MKEKGSAEEAHSFLKMLPDHSLLYRYGTQSINYIRLTPKNETLLSGPVFGIILNYKLVRLECPKSHELLF
jgi:hypothetical protein